MFEDNAVKREILSLKVDCVNNTRSCGWCGELREFQVCLFIIIHFDLIFFLTLLFIYLLMLIFDFFNLTNIQRLNKLIINI